MPGHLLIFGFGYTAAFLAPRLLAAGWRVSATHRRLEDAASIKALGVRPVYCGARLQDAERIFPDITHLLSTAPPTESGDPLIAMHRGDMIAAAGTLTWLGYLSTTGVYGDAQGAWVDEGAPIQPVHERGRRRVAAEIEWAGLGEESGAAACVFRLPGIYGPGRSAFNQLRAGTAKRLVKPGQIFSRIHVADIARALEAALTLETGTVLNLADDEPAPPQDVVTHAARLLGVPPPPEEDYAAAEPRLTPMAREFYSANRRIANGRMKEELGIRLEFPSYREGLAAILKAERNAG